MKLLKFVKKIFVEEQNILSNHCEEIEHIMHNCEDVRMDNEPLFLDELFKDECDYSDKENCIDNFKSRVSFEKRKLKLSIFTFDEPTID